MKNACACLGFDLLVAGLENINLAARKKNPARWRAAVAAIAEILAEQKPRVIFLPHEADGHPAHIGVHFLVLEALNTLPRGFACFVVETEFWGQMTRPNLLVESGVEDVADLVAALVGGRGGAAPDFTFGTIYRLRKWSRARRAEVLKNGRCLSRAENAAGLFR